MFQVLYIQYMFLLFYFMFKLCSSRKVKAWSQFNKNWNLLMTRLFWMKSGSSFGRCNKGQQGSSYICKIFFTSFTRDPIAHQKREQFQMEATNTSCVSFRWVFTPNHHSPTILPFSKLFEFSHGMPTIRIWEKGCSFKGNFWKHPAPKNNTGVSNLQMHIPVINCFSSSLTTTTYCSNWHDQITIPLQNSRARYIPKMMGFGK